MCILRFAEREVLRYIQLNLNKLNITHVTNVSKFYNREIKCTFFIGSLKIKGEAELLISLGTFFQS